MSSDNYEDFILFPIEDGYGLGTSYDWNLWTAPQTYLDGAERPYDMGRGVGGGSLINGMCWTRGGKVRIHLFLILQRDYSNGSFRVWRLLTFFTDWQDLQADYDAWVTLGNPGWGWDDLLPYFKKLSNLSAKIPKAINSFKE
jgi:choline dehydrogenase